jgi:hypothetical protein
MIFLNTINETLELKTSSTADIDFQINYVDIIPASSATPVVIKVSQLLLVQ